MPSRGTPFTKEGVMPKLPVPLHALLPASGRLGTPLGVTALREAFWAILSRPAPAPIPMLPPRLQAEASWTLLGTKGSQEGLTPSLALGALSMWHYLTQEPLFDCCRELPHEIGHAARVQCDDVRHSPTCVSPLLLHGAMPEPKGREGRLAVANRTAILHAEQGKCRGTPELFHRLRAQSGTVVRRHSVDEAAMRLGQTAALLAVAQRRERLTGEEVALIRHYLGLAATEIGCSAAWCAVAGRPGEWCVPLSAGDDRRVVSPEKMLAYFVVPEEPMRNNPLIHDNKKNFLSLVISILALRHCCYILSSLADIEPSCRFLPDIAALMSKPLLPHKLLSPWSTYTASLLFFYERKERDISGILTANLISRECANISGSVTLSRITPLVISLSQWDAALQLAVDNTDLFTRLPPNVSIALTSEDLSLLALLDRGRPSTVKPRGVGRPTDWSLRASMLLHDAALDCPAVVECKAGVRHIARLKGTTLKALPHLSLAAAQACCRATCWSQALQLVQDLQAEGINLPRAAHVHVLTLMTAARVPVPPSVREAASKPQGKDH